MDELLAIASRSWLVRTPVYRLARSFPVETTFLEPSISQSPQPLVTTSTMAQLASSPDCGCYDTAVDSAETQCMVENNLFYLGWKINFYAGASMARLR
jgi:hypothetical protein